MDPGGFKTFTEQVEFPVAGTAEFGFSKRVRLPTDAHHLLSRVVCAFDLPELVPNRVLDGAAAVFVNDARQVARERDGLYYGVAWATAQLLTPLDASTRTEFAVDDEHRGTFEPNTAGQSLGGTFDAGALPEGAWAVESLSPEGTVALARSRDVAAEAYLAGPLPASLTLAEDAPEALHTYREGSAGRGGELRTAAHAEAFAVAVAPKTEDHPLYQRGAGEAFVLGTGVLLAGRTYVMDNSANHAAFPLVFSAEEGGPPLGATSEAGVLTLEVPAGAAALHFRCEGKPGMGGELPVAASAELDFAGGYVCPEPVLPRGVPLAVVGAPADLALGRDPEGGALLRTFPNPTVVVAPAPTPDGAPGYAFAQDAAGTVTLAARPPNAEVLEAAGLPATPYRFANPQGEQIRYVDRIAALLVDHVKLLVDKTVVQEQSGVFSVLYGDLSKREAGVEQVFLDRQDRTLTTYADRIPATTVYTPLKLFFCEDLAAALPIYKLRGSVVELEFTFRPFQDTYMTRLNLFNGMVRESRDVPGSAVPDVVSFGATLFVDYVDASAQNLEAFDRTDSYLITGYQRVVRERVAEPEVAVEVQGITAPVQRLVWFVQSEANLAANDALNFTTRSAYDEASAPVFYRSSASHDPQQQILTPADFVVLDPSVATGPNVPQALAHISAAVQNNTAVLYNLYYDFMQTQVVVDQAITQLYEIEVRLPRAPPAPLPAPPP